MFTTTRLSPAETELIAKTTRAAIDNDDAETFESLFESGIIPIPGIMASLALRAAPRINAFLASQGVSCMTAKAAIHAGLSENMDFIRMFMPGSTAIIREMTLFVLLVTGKPENIAEFLAVAPPPYCGNTAKNRLLVTSAGIKDPSEVSPDLPEYAAKFEGAWGWPVDVENRQGYLNKNSVVVAAKKLEKVAKQAGVTKK